MCHAVLILKPVQPTLADYVYFNLVAIHICLSFGRLLCGRPIAAKRTKTEYELPFGALSEVSSSPKESKNRYKTSMSHQAMSITFF